MTGACGGGRVTRRGFGAACAASFVGACARGPGRGQARDWLTWGGKGRGDGEFIRPRGMGVSDNGVYVIDTTGRIQVFTPDGRFLRSWRVPAWENGTPTNIAFRPDGTILTPDTHYSRILEYGPGGELLRQWGEYGEEPGKFIFPTGIALNAEGTMFISEYGLEANRVQVFDADRNYVRMFGGSGNEPGRFRRAMGVELGQGGLVHVCDSVNHRVESFRQDGAHVRSVGGEGSEHEVDCPYDIAIAPSGEIVLAEYGGHCVSRFTASGAFVAAYGSPGRRNRQFNGPRGVAVDAQGRVYAADTDNHRIQRFTPGGLA